MPVISIASGSAGAPHREPARPRSAVHRLSLALVAVTLALSGLVFSEPAPVDALTIALVVLLTTVGLVAINPTLMAYACLWLLAGAAAVLAATLSHDLVATLTHVGVTLYLYLASAVFAAFVAKSPGRHTRLILKAWTWAALAAAAAGLAGYFDVVPGAFDLFTKYGRISGTFKDPNVFAPFLIVPLLYMVHLALERPFLRMLLPLGAAGLLAFVVFLSFSRGAWTNLAVALTVYGYLTLATSGRTRVRLKLVALLMGGAVLAAGVVVAALYSDGFSGLFAERASLTMAYDVGSEGRFGGQEKAVELIAENPMGIGALEFSTRHHPEDVHNVYLSMLLNAGWLGGGIYWILVGLTLVLGLRHALKATDVRPLFLVVYAAFLANALEGLIVDTDHWRHFYLLMAIVWGVMSAPRLACPAVNSLNPGPAQSSRRPNIRKSAAARRMGTRQQPAPRRRRPSIVAAAPAR